MSKKWYTVSFQAKMSEDDIKAMNKYFYDTMSESMKIDNCCALDIEEDDNQDFGFEYNDKIYYDLRELMSKIDSDLDVEDLYSDLLDDGYDTDIEVCGHSYPRSIVLKRVDKVAYDCGKNEFKSNILTEIEEEIEKQTLYGEGDVYRYGILVSVVEV